MNRKMSVIDLNFEPNSLHRAPCPRRLAREHWTHGLFATHRFFTRTQIPPARSPFRWRTTCSYLLLFGPVPLSCFRKSLRDTVACLRALGGKLYHAGIRGRLAHGAFADANEKRDWRTYFLISSTTALLRDRPEKKSKEWVICDW